MLCLFLVGCSNSYGPLWTEESVDLGIHMEYQEASNWCWAAAGQAIVNFYGADVTQSEVVSYTFGRECTPETCNGQHNPTRIFAEYNLQKVGYDYASIGATQEDFMKNRLEHGVPILLLFKHRVVASNHFMVIGGYTPEGFMVYNSAGTYKQESNWTYDEIVNNENWALDTLSYVQEKGNFPAIY